MSKCVTLHHSSATDNETTNSHHYFLKHTLAIFNPEHDLALANPNAHFQPAISTLKFAHDLALLPVWYAPEQPIFAHEPDKTWLESIAQFGNTPVCINNLTNRKINNITPWGWNAPLCKRLVNAGASEEILPTLDQLNAIKALSHRRLAAEAMAFLKEKLPASILLADQPKELPDMEAVYEFSLRYPDVVFKAPWSGSGKGLFFSRHQLTDSVAGWCKRTIKKQGCVMGEKRYALVQDFAMEFFSDGTTVRFVGYSLFHTQGGIYRGNQLMSHPQIEEYLQKWLPLSILEETQRGLIHFLESKIIPYYQGYIGVDMFIFEDNHVFGFNPAVEINLRMTMGVVAHLFYNRYVLAEKKGLFSVDFYPDADALLSNHLLLSQAHPLIVENGRIIEGYLSLCPITEQTNYRIQVMIE